MYLPYFCLPNLPSLSEFFSFPSGQMQPMFDRTYTLAWIDTYAAQSRAFSFWYDWYCIVFLTKLRYNVERKREQPLSIMKAITYSWELNFANSIVHSNRYQWNIPNELNKESLKLIILAELITFSREIRMPNSYIDVKHVL